MVFVFFLTGTLQTEANNAFDQFFWENGNILLKRFDETHAVQE
jgi:hypothetical protein